MLSDGRLNIRTYLLKAAVLAAGISTLVGLCGVIASLAPTSEMAILGAVAFCVVGLIVGGLVGGVGWAMRAPVALSQIGAAYSILVGLVLTTAIEGAFTGGENSTPVSFTSQAIAILVLVSLSVLVGSIPNLLWLLYSRLRSANHRVHK